MQHRFCSCGHKKGAGNLGASGLTLLIAQSAALHLQMAWIGRSASSSLLRRRLTPWASRVAISAINFSHAATSVNALGQPVGGSMSDWTPPPFPPHKPLAGRYCQLEPLSTQHHLKDLWSAQSEEPSEACWTYLTCGPFPSVDEFEKWCVDAASTSDPQFYAIVVGGRAVGFVSYLRIKPDHGAIEVCHVYFSPRLTKTRAATEAIYLLADNAFKLGYRRFEWKCDSFNYPSRSTAARLGFTFEGLFRQAMTYKGRDRDTMWFSIIDQDWRGGLEGAFERWLNPGNFDDDGKQRLRLSELTAPFVHGKP